jgi:amino acid adenylation domain-containing protein
MIHSRIQRALCDRIRALAAAENASVFTVMLAVLEILLARISGRSDITMLVPVACRNRFNAEQVIGYFANVIVLRNDVRDDLPVHELLKNVRTEVMAGLLRQDVPFEQVIKKIRPKRSLGHDPLASVGFSFLPARGSKLELPGVDTTYREISNGGAKFDLHFFVAEVAGELSFTAEYNTDIFDQTTIARFLEQNLVLLEAVVADPGATVAALPILSPAERRRLLVDYNATAAEYPRATVVDLVRTTAVRLPNCTAATFEATSLSYAELDRRSNQVARCLLARGVAPGALVGIAVERSLGMLVGMLGILKMGAAYVPLDPVYPRERLAFMAEDSCLRGLVIEESLAGLVRHETVLRLDADAGEIDAQSSASLDFALDPESIAYVIYTSGSTGKPKGVQIPHRALVNFLVTMAERPGLSESDRLLAVTSLSFDIAGLELWLPLTVGAQVEIAGRETAIDGAALRARVESGQVTVVQATPSIFRMMIEAGWTRSPNLKILVGGEAIPRELADQLLDRAAAVWNMYGPTETTVWSTIHPLRKGQPILIGRPIANTQIYVLDGHLQPRPIGAVGEIFIGGDGVALGYLNRPELTKERFIANPFGAGRIYRTGDHGRFHPDGTIEYLGRLDFQVKIHGHRIELGEIEASLLAFPDIAQSVVMAREDVPGDVRLVAYFVARNATPAADALREHVRKSLPIYMVPQHFVALASVPLLPNGKIDRKALPAPERSASDEAAYVAPRTATEEILAGIWAEVLKLERVSIEENFFELGGHSLLAMRVIFAMEVKTGKRLNPTRFIFESLAQIARAYDEAKPVPKARGLRRLISNFFGSARP